MSQLRENLNPGLEAERQIHLHVHSDHNENVNIVVDPASDDGDEVEVGGGEEGLGFSGGHDSDPPIENENPDGDDIFNTENLSSSDRKELEAQKRAAASHFHRKRIKSTQDSNYIPPYKKNRFFRRQPSVLPSKFLLGGNIRDPLNLASLSDARISAELNKTTPQSSPLPVQGQVPVFIPKNPYDPLGLSSTTPENTEDVVAGIGKNNCNRKPRHRKRPGRKRTDSECSVGTECTEAESVAAADEEVPQKPEVELDQDQEIPEVVPSAPETGPESSSLPSRKRKRSLAEESEASLPVPLLAEHVQDDVPISSSTGPDLDPPEELYKEEEHVSYYPSSSSDYIPMSSTYAPSPFAFDTDFLEAPPYSPYSPFSHFAYTPTHQLQPFSPPPLPEIPHFQRRMQLFSSRPQLPHQRHLSLQRAVFHRPYSRKRTRYKDPIVSPVIPQPGSRLHNRNRQHFHRKPEETATSGSSNSANSAAATATTATQDAVDGKKYRTKDQIFQFGNYRHYYGYRTQEEGDPRLWVLKKEYFCEKDVLDIGCNSGHVTLSIARDFGPRRIHGIDIDYSLITVARKNIRNYMTRDPENKDVVFPRSLPMIYGAMQPPPAAGEKISKDFPYNVSFAHENYVLPTDQLLDSVRPEYDVIVCFSVTKWIHLNYGDDGLKRFFSRMFLHLHPGGILILEPQPWSSYMKKKKLTEKIHENYKNIQFRPEMFETFLLSPEVGFSEVKSLGTPFHNSKGFQRPLLVFTKPQNKQPSKSAAIASTASCTVTSETQESVSVEIPEFQGDLGTGDTGECTSTSMATATRQIIPSTSTSGPMSTARVENHEQDDSNDAIVSSNTIDLPPGYPDEGDPTDDLVSSSSDPR